MRVSLLSDNQIGDRLAAALEALGEEPGETVRGNTALEAARKALAMLSLGLVYASEKGLDEVPGLRKPGSEPSPPP